jgi:DNA-binding response OmpR family regulator
MAGKRPAMIPRLLVVEDDPISRAFLAAALASLPARVDAAVDIAAALALVAAERHALWLVDAHLPDGDGVLALSRLRALRPGVDALAVTAEDDRRVLDALCDAGYLEVLQKPLAIAVLLAAVRRALGEAAPVAPRVAEKLPVWDEPQALRAVGGRREALEKLRNLFLDELPRQRELIDAAVASGDIVALQAILHKLKASAGFVGAARLLQAVHAWSERPTDTARRAGFDAAADDQLTPTVPAAGRAV